MAQHDLGERVLDYAVAIVRLVEALPSTVAGKRIGDQLLRSGTGVGANYHEAQAAESPADFLHKLQLSLKEMRESCYWLQLLARTEIASPEMIAPCLDEALQLRAILSKAVITAKAKRRPAQERS